MRRLIERVERDVVAGDLGSARRRLMSRVREAGYSAELCERIARLSCDMRDTREAGRWFFLTACDDPQASAAIAVFVQSCAGVRERVLGQLPRCFATRKPSGLPECAQRRLAELTPEPGAKQTSARRQSGTGLGIGCMILMALVLLAAAYGVRSILRDVLT
ncbi:MAG: DUF6584 family protein [Planctomycetota bacterium]|nr:DUF6584 family protein [Planctomycetota bacterium]